MSKSKRRVTVESFFDLSVAGASVSIEVTVHKGVRLTATFDRRSGEIVITRQVSGRGNRPYELARCPTEALAVNVMVEELGLDVAKDFGLRL